MIHDFVRQILRAGATVCAQTLARGNAAPRRAWRKPMKWHDFPAGRRFTKAVAGPCPLCYTRADLGRAPPVHAIVGF